MERESLGTRFKRFLLLVVILAVVVFIVVVTQRLSDDALALLVGLAAGLAAMTPALVLLGTLWRLQEQRLQERFAQPVNNATAPPVIVVAPPMLPGYTPQRQNTWDTNSLWAAGSTERKFTVVGGEQ